MTTEELWERLLEAESAIKDHIYTIDSVRLPKLLGKESYLRAINISQDKMRAYLQKWSD